LKERVLFCPVLFAGKGLLSLPVIAWTPVPEYDLFSYLCLQSLGRALAKIGTYMSVYRRLLNNMAL
jgi:hypothetical protein